MGKESGQILIEIKTNWTTHYGNKITMKHISVQVNP